MTDQTRTAKIYAPMLAVTAVVVAIDQLTKAWATGLDRCSDIYPRPTVGFCLAYNQGMAFSVGWGAGKFISAVALFIVILLYVSARKLPMPARMLMAIIAGGALGNVLDRAFRAPIDGPRGFMGGAVVDFLYSSFWATFNVADTAVVVGGILLSILLWRMPDPDAVPDASAVAVPDGSAETTVSSASASPAPAESADESADR